MAAPHSYVGLYTMCMILKGGGDFFGVDDSILVLHMGANYNTVKDANVDDCEFPDETDHSHH